MGRLVEAAIVRRCALEEALLWVAWSCAFPGATFVDCADLDKILQLGGPTLAALSGYALKQATWGIRSRSGGSSSFSPEPEQLRSRVSFEELLTWLQSSTQNRSNMASVSSQEIGLGSKEIQ